ncbi:LAFE_0C03224g1_1 [Lachancea fermentati]|uniref:LAFE_0C03224g1_1 n=1 Tax=Lachancea fermentati TaxID=4955 RepID=A0A1G4M9G6_LACFM|nr:LAFE_0C03224g1_1 [Lachancea fermentati]
MLKYSSRYALNKQTLGIMTRNYKRMKRQNEISLQTGDNAINKLSHVKLSDEQLNLKESILAFAREKLKNYNGTPSMYVIQGDAGTGKSVVLNALFNDIQRLALHDKDENDVINSTRNYLVVNHPEMLKLYHRISKSFPYISKSSLERPTSLINTLQKEKSQADIIIVDEAHLLSTSKDAFKRFYGENHLQDLMELGKVLVVVYDDKQALRMGSYWEEDAADGSSLSYFYNQLPKENKNWQFLKQQFRVVAEPDMLEWIEQLSTVGKILPFPKSVSQKHSNFDFRIWEDCGAMFSELKALNEKYGQCRMLATYDFPYRLDGKDYFVTCGDSFKVRWDRYTPREQTPWSEREDTIDEVGSVYTIQGFDLNYAGVILGRSVGYNKETDRIELKPELYDDRAGFTKKKNIKNPEKVKHKIIMNSINVLLTRGVKGLYIYAYDAELRERLTRC